MPKGETSTGAQLRSSKKRRRGSVGSPPSMDNQTTARPGPAPPTPSSWPCRWDGRTLPYIPEPITTTSIRGHGGDNPQSTTTTCVKVYWRNPASNAIRVCVPNSLGHYTQLVPGVLYYEAPWHVIPVEALPTCPAVQSRATQVDWSELPAPPEKHLLCFLPPS